ncbi:HERC1 [Symbiodinium sp. CCMP2592]|nr:HERC1 [Symbiodinium sp. CCMP2592]
MSCALPWILATVLCWGSPEIDRDEDLVERQVLLQHGGPLSCEFTEDPVDWPSLLAALRGVAANFSHSSVMITAVQLQEHFEADKGRDVRLDGCFLGLLAVRLMSVYVSGAHHHMFLRASQDWMVHQGFNDFMALPFVNVLKSPFVHSTVAALGAYSRQTREACPALRGPPGIQSEWEAKQFGHLWCFMTEGSPPMVMKVQGANLASPWCGVQEPLAPASPYTGFVRRASDEQATRVLQPLWQAAEEALSQRRPTRRLAVATHAYFSQQTVACAEAEATASLAAAWIGQLPHMFAVRRAQDSLKDLSFLQATYTRWPVWDLMMQMAARPTAGLTDGLQPSSCISLEPCRRTVTFYRRLRMQLGSELLECPEASDALALSYRHGLLRLESNYSELIRLRGNNLPELLLLDITRVLQRMGMEDMENSHAWVSKYVVQRAVSVEELPVRLGWEGMRISSPIHRFGDVHIEPQRLGPRKRARRSRLPFGFSDRRASVYILIVESASRTAFEAFCPKTMAFLRRQSRLERPVRADEESPNSRKWRVVDLALFHALYGGTVANMVPALTGFSFDMAKDSERRAGWRCETVLEGIPEGRLLWNIAKKHGYKTLFGATGCNGFLGTRYCRKWLGQFDRVVPSLEIDPNCHSQHEWRAMMLERKGKRGCIGGKRPSEHLLDYFLRFQEIHSDGPVFAYLHLEASHESQHALQLLDEALAAHLEGLSRLPPEARPLLVLAGDHGPPNECDEKSPLVSFLVPEARLPDVGCGGLLTNCGLPHLQSNLTGTLRGAAEENARLWRRYMWNLEQNRFVISSWYDVYATLRHIISGKDPGGAAQNELQWDAPDHRARSLLSKLPRRRTCTQAGVPEWHCGCARTWVGYCPLSKRGQWAIAVRALEEVNQLVEAAGPKFRVDSSVCRPMQLEQLLNCEMHLPSYQRIQHNLQGKGKEDRTIIRLRMLTTHGMEFEFYVYMRFKSLSGNLQDVEGYVDEFLKLFPRSRYRPNEHCTPTNLDPAFCACGDEAELRKRPAIDEDLPT